MAKTELRDFYTTEATCYESKRYGSRYGRLFRVIHRTITDRLLSRDTKWKKALDVASGTGQMIPSLMTASEFVIACDLTPAMLEVSRRSVEDSTISFCVADATSLPYPSATFDVVSSARFLHLFAPAQQSSFIKEMARVLAPNGILIIDFYNESSRRLFWPFVFIYRFFLRKRPEQDYRVTVSSAQEMIAQAGLKPIETVGVGNFLLAPFSWMPTPFLVRIATSLSRRAIFASEQFIVVATKS